MRRDLLETVLQNVVARQRKTAEMSGEDIQQEMAAPPEPGGPMIDSGGIDPMTGQPLPPPVDPATGQPMDPAAMDPAAMDPAAMDPAAMEPQEPPTLEELLATGDPLIQLIVDINDKVDGLAAAMKTLMDNANMVVPASEVMSSPESVATAKPPAASETKSAMAPQLIDDTDPDEDELKGEFLTSMGKLDFEPEPVIKLGSASSPGQRGGQVIPTGLNSTTGRNKALSGQLRQRRF